jgi:hypothetical protein
VATVSDYAILCAMQLGGSFFRQLADAAFAADAVNLAKLKAAFADEWREYAELARMRYERGVGPK